MPEKVSDIPLNLADIIKMTVRGQTKINLELTGSEEPIAKADRMVDRLVFGIIDGALLIGSSMLCTTNMHPQFWGFRRLVRQAFLLPFFCLAYCCWTLSENINRVRRREQAAAHFFCSWEGNENGKKEYIKMKQWKRLAWLPALALTVGLLLAGCGQNAAGDGSGPDEASVSEGETDSAEWLSGKHHVEIEVRIMARLRWNWMPMLRLPR